jgi:hypothetical protein
MSNQPPVLTRPLATVATAIAAILAVGCQSAPPPATVPVTQPATIPTVPVRQTPSPQVTCGPTTSAHNVDAASFDSLEGVQLDLTAFGAALDALSGTGTVDITTEEAGRPEFRTVEVSELDRTLRTETDPVLAVEASTSVQATALDPATAPTPMANGTGDPLQGQQWSDWVTPYSPTWVCGQGAGVDIAVLDTGVDRTHPDLADHTTTGGASLDGAASVTIGEGGVDPHGHGTHVAGIAAATAGNGVGTSGVAPLATIIPVRVLGPSGVGMSSDVAAGITWAVDAGAEVINLSLGAASQSQAMTNAITYARANGVLVVAAAGNGGALGPSNYPAADNRTLAVASIDSSRQVSVFSTHGSYVDIAAPGSAILSTLPGGTYGYKSGTSMATPFVSGVAALLIGLEGSMAPDALANRLTSTADDAGAPGVDPAFGHGIINPVRTMSG